ncbi:major facilitator superfamily domain-containing protein [Xylariales sp. PMI_506]|nr:major facilitator superfamily domain-containing protein [Xylariales sp. PMI_506]
MRQKKKSISFYFAFLSLVLMVLVVSLDATALAVAIPVLTSQLGGTTLEAFWASLAFMLAVVVTQPLYTSASDLIGRKPLLYSAFIVFFVGSIVFSVAQSMTVVIVGRLLQGLGGGGLDVLNEVIICDITTLKERPFWLGLFAIPMATGSILGPIIGALFSEYVNWRWIGWINLPLVVVSAVCAVFFMHLKPIEGTMKSRLLRLDWIGMALFTVGCTSFSLPLSWAGSLYAWRSWQTILPLVIGAIVLAVFIVYERRPAQAVIPYRFLNSRSSLSTLLNGFLQGFVLYPLLLYLPLFFQAVFLETPLQSAVSILPSCCILIAFSFISGLAIDHLRKYTWMLWFSWVVTALGSGLYALLDENSSLAARSSFQVLAGLGLGIQFVVPSVAIQASAKADDHGLAVGILVSFRLFGALIGLAIGSTTFSSVFGKSISSLHQLPQALSVLNKPADAVGFIPYLRSTNLAPEVMDAVRSAYNDSFKAIWYVMAAASTVGFFLSLLVKEHSIETEEVGRQHLEEV